tara:strand:- start:7329 stop:8147 length:819 start_codon:yes stop_codon:yes gene_type:complete
METKIRKLAIIAGDGDIPIKLVAECIKKNINYVLILIEGHGKDLKKLYKPDFVVSLSKIGKAIKFSKSAKVSDIIMVGGVKRPSFKKMIPDLWTAKFLAKIGSKISGDNSILSNLAKELEREGFNILSAEDILPNLICPKGVIGKFKPDDNNKKDIKIGFEIAKNIGENDIGQSLVIQNGLVLAVEAAEGTDSMILRSKSLKIEEKGGIFIKVLKPNQDNRMDRPVVGVNTLKAVLNSGLDGLALEANSIFILNYNSVVEFADNNNLFIIGV